MILDFRTFMTGEVFALLAKESVLRHSMDGDGWDAAAFLEAVDAAIVSPESTLSRLFSLRAGSLLEATTSDVTRARLSGLLLGLELAGARDFWQGKSVAIIGDTQLAEHYATAFAAQGVVAEREDGEAMTLTGLAASRRAPAT
jgi:2-dehydro-3-deoxygalactonokinase